MFFPISPPSASISLTKCPLEVPPIFGLQGINAILSTLTVKITVSNPNLAQANASAISNYANQILAETQSDVGTMLTNLMLLYMNGYNVLSDTQQQSLTTSQGNSTKSENSTESTIKATDLTQLALQMAMLSSGFGGSSKV